MKPLVALLALSALAAAEPLFDHLDPAAYGSLLRIKPTGYFEVARRFVHPPRVEWRTLDTAVRYRLHLVQDGKIIGTTEAESSPCIADGGWKGAHVGKASIVIEGFDAAGKRIALSRLFPFVVAPDFDPLVAASPARPFRAAALAAFEALDQYPVPLDTALPSDGPQARIRPIILASSVRPDSMAELSYPALHDWLYIDMAAALLRLPDLDASLRQRVREFARSAGEHLLLCRLPAEENIYAGLVRGVADWHGGPAFAVNDQDDVTREKYSRLVEPAKCGYAAEALLKLYEMLGDRRYLDAATEMGEVFAHTQEADGSWPARVDGRTGEILAGYTTSVAAVISFLERLDRHRPEPRWTTLRDKALVWMETYPLRSFGWVLGFDDVASTADADHPYSALSNWDLFHYVRHLSGQPAQLANAPARLAEQMDWNDNHFVFYGPDPLLPIDPWYPTCAEQGTPSSFRDAGDCWIPMDFHTANWGLGLLAMHRLTGDPRWLEKARAAASALTRYQLPDGRTLTWMPDRHLGLSAQANGTATQDFWPAGWAAAATLWAELAVP